MPSLSDLLNMGKQYVKDAMPGGLLNPEVNRQDILDGAALSTTAVPVLGDLLGLGADINRYATDPESRTAGNFALSGLGMLPFVPAMTAWHGSPHKFDKFSLDKIGTGEGAQAYGHGLYLAENQNVAKEYAEKLALPRDPTRWAKTPEEQYVAEEARRFYKETGQFPDAEQLRDGAFYYNPYNWNHDFSHRDLSKAIDSLEKNGAFKAHQNLYKTDIPDEAVARFLDWDKPLSQQSEEVRSLIAQRGPLDDPRTFGFKNPEKVKGADIYNILARGSQAKPGIGEAGVSEAMFKAGIPGIRYLDGGSRPTGQVDKQLLSMLDKHGGDPVAAVDDFMRFVHNTPAKKAAMRDQFLKELQQNRTSNFVAFDPEMIRILERNGQPTGLGPWKPGEYSLGGLLGR